MPAHAHHPEKRMLLNSKAPPIPTSPMTRINRVILKEESSFISLEVSMSFAILWPNWLRLTPYTSTVRERAHGGLRGQLPGEIFYGFS